MLMIEEIDGSLQYDVSRTSHHGLMKLFAFATVLIHLFRKGLTTYSLVGVVIIRYSMFFVCYFELYYLMCKELQKLSCKLYYLSQVC